MDDQRTVAISGASGFIGSALTPFLESSGWSVTPIVRDPDADGIYWSIDEGTVDREALDGVDAVIHLAGENIADGRWSESHRRAILNSRKQGTELLAETVASLSDPPEVFICSSAVDYYGPRGDEWVDESDGPGEGFLPEVCSIWEAACEPARRVARVVNTRQGMALDKNGGPVERMLLPFKMGLGGRLGDGKQYWSWIAFQDLLRAFEFILGCREMEGAVNVTSPNPVINAEFTQIFGEVLGRPTIIPVPGFALKVAFGAQFVEETLLSGQRVRPARLLDAGFEFEFPELEGALEAALSD